MAKKKDEISREELLNFQLSNSGPFAVEDLGWWIEWKTAGKYATIERQFIIEAFDALESCRANIEDINSQFKKSWSKSLATLRRRPYDPKQENKSKISLGEVKTYAATFDGYGCDKDGKTLFIELLDVKDEEGRKLKSRLSLNVEGVLNWIHHMEIGKKIWFSAQIMEYNNMHDELNMTNITLFSHDPFNK